MAASQVISNVPAALLLVRLYGPVGEPDRGRQLRRVWAR